MKEKLNIYATDAQGRLLVGIKGRYNCTPRWYKLRYSKRYEEEYVLWRGRRKYLNEMKLVPGPKGGVVKVDERGRTYETER